MSVDPSYHSPSSKVLVSSGIILAEKVSKSLWVHIEVVVKVTVPPEWSTGKGERRVRVGEREREGGRGGEREREGEIPMSSCTVKLMFTLWVYTLHHT